MEQKAATTPQAVESAISIRFIMRGELATKPPELMATTSLAGDAEVMARR